MSIQPWYRDGWIMDIERMTNDAKIGACPTITHIDLFGSIMPLIAKV